VASSPALLLLLLPLCIFAFMLVKKALAAAAAPSPPPSPAASAAAAVAAAVEATHVSSSDGPPSGADAALLFLFFLCLPFFLKDLDLPLLMCLRAKEMRSSHQPRRRPTQNTAAAARTHWQSSTEENDREAYICLRQFNEKPGRESTQSVWWSCTEHISVCKETSCYV